MSDTADGPGGQQQMLASKRTTEEPAKTGRFPLGWKEGLSQWVGFLKLPCL